MNKGLLVGLVVLAAVVGVALFFSGGKSTQAPTTTQATSTPSATTATEEGAMIKEVSVSASEYSFTPSSITLKAGEEAKIVFKNAGNLPHNLVVDELGVSTKTIGAGKEDAITVTADKAGTYTFYCSVGNHRQLGMEGKLTVQ